MIAVIAIVPGIFTWAVNTEVTAKAASVGMATQSWQASFSVSLKKNKLTDNVYVTTEKGKKSPCNDCIVRGSKKH
ncbi:hypothetical protein OL548_07795 [Lysinibacillus sp. MHQ-1]|nr:hypothetical protein OL548_07795 [Lysinibacillus sp. MHQ-1]